MQTHHYQSATGYPVRADQDHSAYSCWIDPPTSTRHTANSTQTHPHFRRREAVSLLRRGDSWGIQNFRGIPGSGCLETESEPCHLWRDDSWKIQHRKGISSGGLICAESESRHPSILHLSLAISLNHRKAVDRLQAESHNEGLSEILGGLPHPIAAAFLCSETTASLRLNYGYMRLLWRDDSWKIEYLREISGGGYLMTESESCHLSTQRWYLFKTLGGHRMAITHTASAEQQANPYASLSFVQPSKKGHDFNFWAVPPVSSYSQACRFGYQFGADFAHYLLKNPSWVGGNILGNIIGSMDLERPKNIDGDDQRHGCIVGFLSYLERLVYEGAKQLPPQQLANQLQGQAIKLDLLQQIREMNGTEPDDSWYFADEGSNQAAEPPETPLTTATPVA